MYTFGCNTKGISLLHKQILPKFSRLRRAKNVRFRRVSEAKSLTLSAKNAPKARENLGILRVSRGKTFLFRVPNVPKAREKMGYFEGFQRGNHSKIGDFWDPKSGKSGKPLNYPPLVKKSQISQKSEILGYFDSLLGSGRLRRPENFTHLGAIQREFPYYTSKYYQNFRACGARKF